MMFIFLLVMFLLFLVILLIIVMFFLFVMFLMLDFFLVSFGNFLFDYLQMAVHGRDLLIHAGNGGVVDSGVS